MKVIVLVVAITALCERSFCYETVCSGSFIPVIPGDNSHYVEGESRYIWMPDGDGVPHLADLHEPADEELLKSRNGANNQYWLFTRRNPNNPQILILGNFQSVAQSQYDRRRSVVVIAHGWNSNVNSDINALLTHAFLAREDCNVVVVDWRALANSNYVTAVDGVPSVGEHLSLFLNWLFITFGGSWDNLHLIGFNLGAHVVGVTGRSVGGRAARVTGLDPVGPLWVNNNQALNAQAGQYVEAIHTDLFQLGFFGIVGHADFYPNGGSNQPGCFTSACSHNRASELFAATLHFNHLVGRQCDNFDQAGAIRCSGAALNMGNNNLNKRGSGIFGLRTGAIWPF